MLSSAVANGSERVLAESLSGHTGCLGYCVLVDTLEEDRMRRRVNKRRSAAKFRRQVRRTKGVNLARPGRGGFRM